MVDFSPITSEILGILYVVVSGGIIWLIKEGVKYLKSKGLDINGKNVVDFVDEKLEGMKDELMETVTKADEIKVEHPFVRKAMNQVVEEIPVWLKEAGYSKGKIKKRLDYDKIFALVMNRAKSFFSFQEQIKEAKKND